MQEFITMKSITEVNQNGFTLIEIMIAIAVFTIGILALTSMQIRAVQGNSFACGLTEASILAQDKMEELIMLGYNDPNLNDTYKAGIYTMSWNIAVNVPYTNTKTISIVVTWVENGAPKQVAIQSIKSPM